MSVADTLADAVSDLDDFIEGGTDWGEAATYAPWHAELLDVRARMDALRTKIDAAYGEAIRRAATAADPESPGAA